MFASSKKQIMFLGFVALVVAGGIPNSARAGCGCEHPAPFIEGVFPPFAAAGSQVLVNGTSYGVDLIEGAQYAVTFAGISTAGVGMPSNRLLFTVPNGVAPGPAAIHIKGQGVNVKLPSEQFMVLGQPLMIPGENGAALRQKYQLTVEMAVDAEGALYLPFDFSAISDPAYFVMGFTDLPFDFAAADIEVFNFYGVSVVLPGLITDGVSGNSWVSHYVDLETGIPAAVAAAQVHDPEAGNLSFQSDKLMYWRHEMHTYHEAHLPGHSHETTQLYGFDLVHRDYQRYGHHTDLTRLVLRIPGRIRDAGDPQNAARYKLLPAGAYRATLFGLTETLQPTSGEVPDGEAAQVTFLSPDLLNEAWETLMEDANEPPGCKNEEDVFDPTDFWQDLMENAAADESAKDSEFGEDEVFDYLLFCDDEEGRREVPEEIRVFFQSLNAEAFQTLLEGEMRGGDERDYSERLELRNLEGEELREVQRRLRDFFFLFKDKKLREFREEYFQNLLQGIDEDLCETLLRRINDSDDFCEDLAADEDEEEVLERNESFGDRERDREEIRKRAKRYSNTKEKEQGGRSF